ncbi:MAG: branched-chain amino acid ABC transporter permease [candidate division Zixibacteria bacterium]|nr:branched-chain amino acid ABC transporter permease [candidate division Zixibacteria bacterium]
MSEFLQQMINGIAWGSIYALIALGYTMVYGVLRLINFAHGDVYMVGAFAGFYAVKWLGLAQEPTIFGAVAVFLLSMGCCGILGFVIERGAYKPLRKAPRLTALITAIGVSLFLENAGQLIFGADPKFFPQIIAKKDVISSGGIILTNQQVIVLGVSLLLMVSLQLFVLKTKTGKAMRAVSFNREAASLMGISVDRIISITFVLGSALAAAAAILVALTNPKIEPLMGIMPGIKAFVAAVLGGIGNIPGAMLGGMIMGIAEVMVVGYLSSTYRDAIAFAILILILLFKPSGLLGGFTGEKA